MKKKFLFIFLFMVLGVASGFLTYKVILLSKKVAVPDLKGQPPQAAMNALKDLGLRFEIKSEDFDPVVPQGYIVSQEPAPGENVRLDTPVQVALSLGPSTPRTPSVLGKTLDEAVSLLNAAGLKILNIISIYSGNQPKGTIIAQDPNLDEKSGPVSVIVSNGPSEVSYYCPDFTGMSIAQAQNLAAGLGLEPVFDNAVGFGAGGQNVISQKPDPGAKIAAGQKVFLSLGQPNVMGPAMGNI